MDNTIKKYSMCLDEVGLDSFQRVSIDVYIRAFTAGRVAKPVWKHAQKCRMWCLYVSATEREWSIIRQWILDRYKHLYLGEDCDED